MEAKQIPLHGPLQTETDLGFAVEGGHFSPMFVFGKGGNIKMRWGYFLFLLLKGCAVIEMHWKRH